ncbi:hypothetical protein SAMN05216316_1651 [Nitrosovibrio sp. Nv6]|nr:hypothetical protein SAMN05216316_1651 [Nitrosovibrio sp. Nv6]
MCFRVLNAIQFHLLYGLPKFAIRQLSVQRRLPWRSLLAGRVSDGDYELIEIIIRNVTKNQ